jgi:hypothetical protein
VHHDAEVAKEALVALGRRRKQVEVRRLELVVARGDLAVLAAQVADLARLGRVRVARRRRRAPVGVQVGQRLGAVAVGGDGRLVQVVGFGRG